MLGVEEVWKVRIPFPHLKWTPDPGPWIAKVKV